MIIVDEFIAHKNQSEIELLMHFLIVLLYPAIGLLMYTLLSSIDLPYGVISLIQSRYLLRRLLPWGY